MDIIIDSFGFPGAAKLTGCGESKLRQYVKEESIPFRLNGNRVQFSNIGLSEWMLSQERRNWLSHPKTFGSDCFSIVEKTYGIKEAAILTGCGEAKIRQYVRDKSMPFFMNGNRARFTDIGLREWICFQEKTNWKFH